MAALGVSGDPTRLELIARLKDLRDGAKSGALPSERVVRDSAIVYKALAESCKDSAARADLREIDLRKEFREGDGLILTNLGWQVPDGVLAGPSVFGQYKAFAPPIPGTELLWSVLRLKTPSTAFRYRYRHREGCLSIRSGIEELFSHLGRTAGSSKTSQIAAVDEARLEGRPPDLRDG